MTTLATKTSDVTEREVVSAIQKLCAGARVACLAIHEWTDADYEPHAFYRIEIRGLPAAGMWAFPTLREAANQVLGYINGSSLGDASDRSVHHSSIVDPDLAVVEYKLLENVAAIASSVFGDARIEAHIQTHDIPYNQRLEWCVDAAKAMTAKEPSDPVAYDEAKLDWIYVIDAIADGFFADADPADAVASALNPTAAVSTS